MEASDIFTEYGMGELQEGIDALFPDTGISLEKLWGQVFSGDVTGALGTLSGTVLSGFRSQAAGMGDVFAWLMAIGIFSALLHHFSEIFGKNRTGDTGFYVMYLLLITVVLKCFGQAADTTVTTLENVILFIRLLMPAFLLGVGMASGTATLGAWYQLMLLLIYAVENILMAGVIPFVYVYVCLTVINGVWGEERLSLLMKLTAKGIRAVLKASLGVVTGISAFQAMITPALDAVHSATLQKLVAAIPGIGGAADGIWETVLGSAVVIKNSIGVVMLLLLVALCAAPLCKILVIAGLPKAAAALMGIISDKRITACTDQVGEGSLLLLKTAASAMLLFAICVSVVAAATNRGV